MKRLLFLLVLLFSPAAHAGTYWTTVALTTDTHGAIKGGVLHPALGTLKNDGYTLAVISKDRSVALIQLTINDKDLPTLKTVAAKVHGKEGSKTKISATLKKKLCAEAKRLGASASWQPGDSP